MPSSRPGILSVFVLLLTGAVLPAQDDTPSLPRPKASRPAPDEAARKALAARLCTAIDAGDVAAVARALDDGANPDVGIGAGSDSTKGRTPLIHAVVADRPVLVELLVSRGARLDAGDDGGHTPLMYAALLGNTGLGQLLVRLGARTDAKDKDGKQAGDHQKDGSDFGTWLATAAGKDEALLTALAKDDLAAAKQALADGASPNANDGHVSLLMYAVRQGDLDAVRELLPLGCRPDLLHQSSFLIDTPLGAAAEAADLELLQALLAAGKPSRPALDLALASAAGSGRSDRMERVRLLLAAGANPAAATLLQTPALPAAASRGDLQTMTLLLTAGADQAAVDHALLRAAGLEDAAQALTVVRALLAIGADPDHEHLYATALGAAAVRGHEAVLALLFPATHAATRNLAVAEAAREGKAAGLRWLCEHGKGGLDFQDKPGPFDTPLLAAIGGGHHECLRVLLANGADANQPPVLDDDAPLVSAVRRKDLEAIDILLQAGADPQKEFRAVLTGRHSALSVAEAAGDEAVLQKLRKAGKATGEPGLAAALTASGLKFTDSGTYYRLQYERQNVGRKQQVYLRKKVEEYGSLRAQEAYSLCYEAAEPPSAELLRKAFLHRYSVGGLVLEAPSEKQKYWRIRFRVAVPCDASPQRLSVYLDQVQAAADELEQELNPSAEDRL